MCTQEEWNRIKLEFRLKCVCLENRSVQKQKPGLPRLLPFAKPNVVSMVTQCAYKCL